MDFLSKIIDLRSVSLEKVTSTILTAQKKKEPQEDSSQINNTFQWHILSKALEMESGSVSLGVYKNPGLEAPDSLLTYAGLNLDIKDLILHDDRAGIRLKNLGFSMNNGFLLKEMKGELESDKNQTELRMAIETRNSRIHLEGSSEEGLFNMISKPDEIQKARLKIDKSLVSIRDIVYFIPGLSDVPFFESLASGPVNLGGDLLVEGSMFTVSELSIAQGRNYNISLDGFTDYPGQLSKSRGNLDLGITHIDQSWLEALLSGLGFEDSIPDQTGMAVHANISGLFAAPDFAIDIRSHLGSIDMAGSLDFAKDRFALGASFGSLSLGELLSNPQIGSFTGRGEFSGQGLLGDSLRATLSFQVDSFSFHDYSYSQTDIQGELRPGQYSFNIQADDPSLHGELVAIINPLDTVFKVNTKGIISAQLNELRLYKDTLRIESKIESKLLKSEGLLETELIATRLSLATPHDTARVEQLKAIYIMDTLNSMLQTSSDFFNIEMQAAKSIREPGLLADGFRNYLTTFIDSTQVHDSTRISLLPEFNLAGWMTFHKTLNFFVPDSGFHFDRLDFSLISRPSENRMNYSLTGGGIQYKIVKADSLNIMITDTAGMINSKLLADKTSIRSGPEYRWEITGNTGGWKALSDLSVRDAMGQIVYEVEVSGILESKILLLEIPSRQLVLNRSPWQMEAPGLLKVDLPGKTVLPDFRMHTDSSMLHLYAIEKEGVISYTLDVDRIYLASLLRKELISGRPEGILSGSIYYSGEENAEKSITTELQIEDITYHDLDLDNINLNGSMTFGPLDAYSIHMMARLDSSRAELNAERKDGGARNLSSSLTLFPLKTIQLFASDHVSDIEGSVSGNFSISSANDIEEYNGELMLADASMRLNLLNSIFRIPDQRVELKNGKMILDQFTILDTLDKKMNVDGYIDFGDKGPAMVDLSVASSKMKVMSRAPKSKATFSGNVFVDSKVSVKGPVTSPVFEGKILLSKGTEIYYQQLDELRQPEAQKVVSFVDNSQARDQNIATRVDSSKRFHEFVPENCD